jgi:tricorn protease
MNVKRISLLLIAMTFTVFVSGQEARLLRFPTISGDQIVFSYAGDLYSVHSNGGMARKLTTHNGYEMFPKFSPDGRHIAFTAQYDGNTEVFVIPATGGVPKRLTFTATLGRDDIGDRMGPNNIVMAWTPDSRHIIYRSRKQSFNSFVGQLFKVPLEGGLSEEIPLSKGGFCSFSPDGRQLAFNWVFREFRTWKYYEGGMTDDIRIYDFESKEVKKITDNPHQDIIPMWMDDQIFFLSDRDRIMNLFKVDPNSAEIQKVTDFTDYDIKFPSHNPSEGIIVFEKGGYIYRYHVSDNTTRKVPIEIANDQIYSRNEIKDASKDIRGIDLSPNGERILFSARGDVFSVPAKDGFTVNLTNTSGVHERNASWSPDGQWIAFISDQSGEFEIYIMKHDGSEPPVQVTRQSNTYIFGFEWSPDSKKILYNDKKQQLVMVDIESKESTMVDQSDEAPWFAYNWSPDSQWITYTKSEKGMTRIRLFDVASKKSYLVTEGWYESNNPSFSADGKYLVFTSARDFNPIYSQTEWNHAYRDMSRIYLATLSKSTPSPFALKNDEVQLEDQPGGNPGKKEQSKASEEKDPSIEVDPDGITQRIISLPVDPGNYFNVHAVNGKVYYLNTSMSGNGMSMKMYDLNKQKETELGNRMQFTLSPNKKKMLVRQNGRYGVIDLPGGKISLDETADLSDMKVRVDYKAEWKQIFDESWRQMRDFFYAPNMHGVDWNAMHDKYEVFLPYVNHRTDLTYILGEMMGELNVGHAYVSNGERPMPERIQTGLLGAKVSPHSSGYFIIDHILKGANWSESLRSPLTEIGVNIDEGEYILAINGRPTDEVDDLYELLVGKAGKEVELTVNSKPEWPGHRKVLVKPVSDESSLYYFNWVQRNIDKVSEATDGEVGYLHVPDMGVTGLNEFVKYYYPQLTKKGLIIDVRGNGGGNVSPMLIERLMRSVTYITMHTGMKTGNVNPVGQLVGPKVTLVDQYSASDGDLFPYRFKYNEIGTLIGTRSWGGVVGYSGSIPCIDGGYIITPSYAPFAADGSGWIIEGIGVEPDIFIENDPSREYRGMDDQLNKAIEVIQKEIENFDYSVPPVPPPPDKTGDQ